MAPRRKFQKLNVPKAAEVAPAEEAARPVRIVGGKTLPKAGDLTIEDAEPQRAKFAKRVPVSAPLIICIYKVSDRAPDIFHNAPEDAGLYQIQFCHEARPSLLFDAMGSWNEFLRELNEDDDTVPASIQELQRLFIKFVSTSSEDPDNIGMVPWRPALYVCGNEDNLKNALALVDDWLAYKQRRMAKEKAFDVQVHSHVSVPVVTKACFAYEGVMVNEPARSLPLKVFQVQPCFGKKIVTMLIETENAPRINIVFSGQVLPYRSRFDDFGIPPAHITDESGQKTYFRVLKDVDLSVDEEKERALSIPSEILGNLAVRLQVTLEPNRGTPAAAFLDALRELVCIHPV